MEPTIYKPSIYKGAGIYKAGAEGGGGIEYIEVDIASTDYKAIKINDKIWLAENLNYKFPGGNFNPNNWDSNYNYAYYNFAANEYKSKYGLFYNWYAAKYIEENKDILIPGWRVPTKQDFESLFGYVDNDFASYYLRSWGSWNNTAGINKYSFNALPNGRISSGGASSSEGESSFFWTSTEYNTDDAYLINLYEGNEAPNINTYSKRGGFAIRLIKDE